MCLGLRDLCASRNLVSLGARELLVALKLERTPDGRARASSSYSPRGGKLLGRGLVVGVALQFDLHDVAACGSRRGYYGLPTLGDGCRAAPRRAAPPRRP